MHGQTWFCGSQCFFRVRMYNRQVLRSSVLAKGVLTMTRTFGLLLPHGAKTGRSDLRMYDRILLVLRTSTLLPKHCCHPRALHLAMAPPSNYSSITQLPNLEPWQARVVDKETIKALGIVAVDETVKTWMKKKNDDLLVLDTTAAWPVRLTLNKLTTDQWLESTNTHVHTSVASLIKTGAVPN